MTVSKSDTKAPGLLLGKEVAYPEHYDAAVLCPIARQQSRQSLGIDAASLPFVGVDIWNAYELSWLDSKGKPVVARGEFRFAADTAAIIESKSFKLYLNSLNQTRFDSRQALLETLTRDLSASVAGPVRVVLTDPATEQVSEPVGRCLDEMDIDIDRYTLNPEYLTAGSETKEEIVFSHLLRSLCPVTGQPDWGSVIVSYRGSSIDHEGLLRYIISYRQHQDFHEHCVERMFMDIWSRCRPESLQVCARYLRRGGLDINPCRSSDPLDFANFRLPRQ